MESWVPSLIGTLFCLILGGNQYRLNDIAKTQASTTKRLDDRVTSETAKLEERLNHSRLSLNEDINQVSSRLAGDIKSIEKGVVFNDVFEQHEKIDELNTKHNEKMFDLIEKRLEASATTNTKEHNRLYEKIDDIPQLIRDEIKNAMLQGGES